MTTYDRELRAVLLAMMRDVMRYATMRALAARTHRSVQQSHTKHNTMNCAFPPHTLSPRERGVTANELLIDTNTTTLYYTQRSPRQIAATHRARTLHLCAIDVTRSSRWKWQPPIFASVLRLCAVGHRGRPRYRVRAMRSCATLAARRRHNFLKILALPACAPRATAAACRHRRPPLLQLGSAAAG